MLKKNRPFKKKATIKSLSWRSDPGERERCGVALQKIMQLEASYQEPLKIDVRKCTYKKLVLIITTNDADYYYKLKNDFLYNYGCYFDWRG